MTFSSDRQSFAPQFVQTPHKPQASLGKSPPTDNNNASVPVRFTEQHLSISAADWRREDVFTKMNPATRNRFKTSPTSDVKHRVCSRPESSKNFTCFTPCCFVTNGQTLLREEGRLELRDVRWWTATEQSENTDWITDRQWFDSRQRQDIFVLSSPFHSGVKAHPALYARLPEEFSQL